MKTSKLFFTNGNSFSGEIQSCQPNNISIQSPFLKNQTNLFTKNLLKISLPDTIDSKTEMLHDHEATIFIKGRHNQEKASDQLKGQIKQITDEVITIQTDYADEIKIDRKFITNMEVNSKKSNHYTGPIDINQWNLISSDDSWYFRQGSFISGAKNGQIAKDIGLDSPSHISFSIDWKDSLNLKTILFSDDINSSRPDNYYELILRTNYAYMRKYSKENGSSSMDGSVSIRQLEGSDTAYIEIFANIDSGVFHLYINGEKSATFNDRRPSKKQFGSAIHFNNEAKSPTRIRNIRASHWSGVLPTLNEENSFTNLKGTGERILLKNGDAIIGIMGEVKEGIIVVDTKHTPVRIPVSGLRTIKMKGSFEEKHGPKMETYDVKAYFRNGGWVIFELHSITADTIVGFHQAFGKKSFKLSAFNQIEFNIYNRKLNSERVTSIW